jgi:hypothetical protein
MTQEQKEAEYKRQQMKLYLKVYKWWRKRHCKHWFREFAKYFVFYTPRMDGLFMRILNLQPAHVKLIYSDGFPRANKDFDIL